MSNTQLSRTFEDRKSVSSFLEKFTVTEFFPTERIARRIMSEKTAESKIKKYFDDIVRQNAVLFLKKRSDIYAVAVIKPLEFESSVFGIRMGELKIYSSPNKSFSKKYYEGFMTDILAVATKTGYAHLYCKLLPDNCSMIQELESAGFMLTSSLITFVYERNITKIAPWRIRHKVRPAQEKDKEAVCDITKGAFKGTRFYNDPFLDNEKCNELYVAWARNCFEKNWASGIFVAENSRKEVSGYFTYLIDSQVKSIFGKIKGGSGISACLPEAKGAYTSFLVFSIQNTPQNDSSWGEYTTPSCNTEVIKMWQKFGLTYGKNEITFHKNLK